MLTAQDKQMNTDLAAKYAARGIFLFGSAAAFDHGYRDIDLAVA
jgi:predicted nucleotidyltransferase